jgi:hypothetical protein
VKTVCLEEIKGGVEVPENEGKGTNEAAVKTHFALQRFKRNAYFYGKLMTVRDFQLEQEYFNEKRYLNNRLVHGRGIVCGLEVESVAFGTGAAADNVVVSVSAGVALDGCGREILADRALAGEKLEIPGIETLNGTRKYYLHLKYRESFGELVPALADASGCEETCCHSRIQEGFKFLLTDEWTSCDEAEDFESPGPCSSGEDAGVLLAVLDISKQGGVKQVSVNESETEKCRRLVYNNPLLHYLIGEQQSLLGQHLNNFTNPHQVKHGQTGPAGWDQSGSPGDGQSRTKHLSAEDAGKWNGAAQNINNHLSNFTNPHQVQHPQTGPLGWDQAEGNDPEEKGKKTKHVSTEDAEKWNGAAQNVVQHHLAKIEGVAQGDRKELGLDVKLNFNEAVVPGLEVRLSKEVVQKWIEAIKKKYEPDEDALKKWHENILKVMEENKIGKIDEYYTGDLSIIDIWALTAQVSEELSPVPRPGPAGTRGKLVSLGLKQVPAPALAVRVDRVAKKLTVILQDRRKEETRLQELVNYTVALWIAPAKNV